MKNSLLSTLVLMLLASAHGLSAQIQMTFSTQQPTCNGFSNGSANVFAIGGTGGYTYLWSTGQNTQTTFGIGAGLYTVTVTDDAQNSAVGSITVLEPSAVSAAITANGVNCDGNSGTLTASGFGGTAPYTYAWGGVNASATETVQVIAPGNYFVTVTDQQDCSAVQAFTVPQPLSVDVIATDIPCDYYPEGGAVSATAIGGLTPYTYSWSNGATTQMQIEVGSGPYICTVTSANGCVAIDSDYVDIPTPMSVLVTWLSPACGGNNNGAATILASGGTPPYTHIWTPGPLNGASQIGLAPGQYYLCTMDANQCQKDIWIEIPANTGLDLQLSVTSATCVGINDATATAIVNPPGSGFTYEWNILPPDSSVVQVTGLSAGTVVSVTVTDPVSGCTGIATGTVGAHSNLNVLVTDVDILCAGGTGSAAAVASNGIPAYQYTWLDGNGNTIGNQDSIFGLSPGAYLVTVVDAAGCIGEGVVDIGISSAPHAIIDGDSVLICGDSLSLVQFTSLSFDTYNQITGLEWHITGPGLDTSILQETQVVFQWPVDSDYTIQLIATSGLGCSDTAILVYNVPGFPDFNLSLDSSSINCVGAPVGIDVTGVDSSYTLVWTPAVTFNPNPLHVLVSPTTTTTYTLTATDGNACTSTESITIAPLDSFFQLHVNAQIIQTCADTAILTATSSIPATIVWTDENGTVIPGNPIVVPATPSPMTYTATATTPDTCVLTASVTVTGVGISISLDPNSGASVCEGDTLPLAVLVMPALDSLNYFWTVTGDAIISNPTSPTPSITGPAGNYTVTVIVGNNFCADTLSWNIEILPGFNLDGQIEADLCTGLVVSFINNSGMSGEWNFGDDSPSTTDMNPVHTYDAAGEYMVVFTPTLLQCTAPWDSMIQVVADTLIAEASHLYVDCSLKATIQFNGLANNTNIQSWDWTISNGDPATSDAQDPLIYFTDEGTYLATLVVTDMNNCVARATDTVVVDIVNDVLATEFLICPNDTIQLNANGIDSMATYLWTATPADPGLDASNPNPSVSPAVPTTYSVTIQQGLCSVTSSIALDFKDGSDVTLPNDTVVCNTNPINITAQSNGAAGYEWSNTPSFSNIFATTQTVSLDPDGTYYVRTTNAAECVGLDSITLAQQMVEVQVEPIDDLICLGEQSVLFVTNLSPDQNLVYDWSPALPNVSNPIVSPTESTTYAVTVTNQFGCTSTLDFTVNVTTVGVDAMADPTEVSLVDPTTTLDATPSGNGTIIGYSWTPAETLSNPNAAQTEANPITTTLYTVTVTTEEGCIAIDTVRVNFRFSDCISPFVFVPTAFTPNSDEINDYFIVKADGMTELKFIIWNRWGEIVYETNDPNTLGWDGTYQGKELTPDSYAWYVLLTCGNGEFYEDKGNVTLLK